MQVLGGALEELVVGEHRQARRAARLVARGDRRRVEILAQQPLGRAGALYLRNDSGFSLRNPLVDGFRETSHGRRLARAPRERGLRQQRPGSLDLCGLGLQDALEDAQALSLRVNATNSSSLRRAAPLSIAWRARSMPAFRVGATPA